MTTIKMQVKNNNMDVVETIKTITFQIEIDQTSPYDELDQIKTACYERMIAHRASLKLSEWEVDYFEDGVFRGNFNHYHIPA
jgi:hypothetical protein